MVHLQTPYACSLCKKEFCNTISLVKHVELIHASANPSSTFPNKNIGTTKSYLSVDNQSHSSNSKNEMKSNNNEPFIIKIEENESGDEEFYNHQHSPNFCQNKTQHKMTYISKILFSCGHCDKTFEIKQDMRKHER